MTLVRFDPLREFDRTMEDIFGPRRASIPMDAYRRAETVFVHFDLPGVAQDSIELTVEQHTLTVAATRQWEAEEGDTLIARERPQGTFRRQLLLADSLDTEKLEASLDNGVLTVQIPALKTAQSRQIPIRGAVGPVVIEGEGRPS